MTFAVAPIAPFPVNTPALSTVPLKLTTNGGIAPAELNGLTDQVPVMVLPLVIVMLAGPEY